MFPKFIGFSRVEEKKHGGVMVSARLTARRSWVQFPGGRACGVDMLAPVSVCAALSTAIKNMYSSVNIRSVRSGSGPLALRTTEGDVSNANFTAHCNVYAANKGVLLPKNKQKKTGQTLCSDFLSAS